MEKWLEDFVNLSWVKATKYTICKCSLDMMVIWGLLVVGSWILCCLV